VGVEWWCSGGGGVATWQACLDYLSMKESIITISPG